MSHSLSPFMSALRRTRIRLATEVTLIVGVLAFGVFIAPAAAAPPAGTIDVEVVNPSASPVPVTGSVTAQVSGSVAVSNLPSSQTVNGTVGVNNFPVQQVSNASASGSNNNIQPGNSDVHDSQEMGLWPEYFTALTAESDQAGDLSLQIASGQYFDIALPAGQTVTESFPFPMVRPQQMTFNCDTTNPTPCDYTFSAIGYNAAP